MFRKTWSPNVAKRKVNSPNRAKKELRQRKKPSGFRARRLFGRSNNRKNRPLRQPNRSRRPSNRNGANLYLQNHHRNLLPVRQMLRKPHLSLPRNRPKVRRHFQNLQKSQNRKSLRAQFPTKRRPSQRPNHPSNKSRKRRNRRQHLRR